MERVSKVLQKSICEMSPAPQIELSSSKWLRELSTARPRSSSQQYTASSQLYHASPKRKQGAGAQGGPPWLTPGGLGPV